MSDTDTDTDAGTDTDTDTGAGTESPGTGPTESFDIPIEVAEIYEERFVPAIFAEWAPIILEAVTATADDRILDVACGTGIVARTARRLLGPAAAITALDLNRAMLTVAERVAGADAGIDWRHGDVADLAFDDASFDVAVCQMAAMFFPDRRRAIAEMARMVGPGGRLAWIVPSALDEQPAYGPFVEVAVAHTDDSARSLLGTYWNCGDREAFTADLVAAGLEPTGSRTRAGIARFASPADFVTTEIDSTPLADRIGSGERARIVAETAERLTRYVRPGQPFEIPLLCNVVTAAKPG